MYKIIKPRCKFPYRQQQELRRFECLSCGCVFETDEWYETLKECPTDFSDFGIAAMCPECGAYLHRTSKNDTDRRSNYDGGF